MPVSWIDLDLPHFARGGHRYFCLQTKERAQDQRDRQSLTEARSHTGNFVRGQFLDVDQRPWTDTEQARGPVLAWVRVGPNNEHAAESFGWPKQNVGCFLLWPVLGVTPAVAASTHPPAAAPPSSPARRGFASSTFRPARLGALLALRVLRPLFSYQSVRHPYIAGWLRSSPSSSAWNGRLISAVLRLQALEENRSALASRQIRPPLGPVSGPADPNPHRTTVTA
jgi:hypothetical protein